MRQCSIFPILAVLAALITGCASSDIRESSVSFGDHPGRFAVGLRPDISLHNEVLSRQVTTTVWYPTNGTNGGPEQVVEDADLLSGEEPFPLVILIPGAGGNGTSVWPYLGPHLASHGFVALTANFDTGPDSSPTVVNRTRDISFLLDAALGGNDALPLLSGRIDTDKIAVCGFSLGAQSAYLLIYDPLHIDSRIKAAIFMAAGDTLVSVTPPINPDITTLGMAGTLDAVIPYSASLNVYESASAPKYLMTFEGGGHMGFSRQNNTAQEETMKQTRQEALTRMAVFGFLTSLFGDSESDRNAATRFLRSTIDAENGDITLVYETGQ